MALKRPFGAEEVNEVSSKHQKQDGPGTEIISHDDGFCKKADIVKLHNLGETSTWKGDVECHDDHENGSCPRILWEGLRETESHPPRSVSFPHWTSSSTSDEDEPSDDMVHMPYYSGCFNFDRPVRPPFDSNDAYYCLFDYPPQKRVPIGPDHQAEIPLWGESVSTGNSDDVNLNGTCIIPNLETQPLAHSGINAGNGRTDCRCPDQGSIRCVRFHTAEAREKLRRVLGEDTFVELGFNNMGEVVSEKWTNEEERLFHEVVFSNPVSLSKNFWVALSTVFPCRTNMEIVSYYFNVFMLRKRAEQNRYDPMNVDSDNDEWQGNDDDVGDNGVSDEDDDDDSGVESPVRDDGLVFHQNELHLHQHEEEDGDVSDDAEESDKNNVQGRISKSVVDSDLQFLGKKSYDGGENDTQDGSCTSSDSGASLQGAAQIQNDGCHDWHEYTLGPTDAKSWDGYMNYPKTNVDLLPTCSMIEEIFGGEFDFNDKSW